MDLSAMTRRQYLTFKSMERGTHWPLAIEAVASTAIEHPEWDMDEVKSYEEWESNKP